MTLPLNPFQRLAIDARMRANKGAAPPVKRTSIVGKVLASNGQWLAPLAPRATGSIHVQGAAAGRADQDRREALRRGSI